MRATAHAQQKPDSIPWQHWFALAAMLAIIIYLECFEKNYFNQDENFIQFGPIIIGACRSLFDHGVFPFWTPYQYMGSEVFQAGLYSLSYPPLYVAYAFARYIVGDEAFWPTVYFGMHAVAAYIAINYLFKRLSVSLPLRAAATISFIFIGYNLVAGRSWYYMMPVMAWLPAIFLPIVYRTQWTRRNWILAAGFSIGLFYQAGNLQMWCYGMLFWLIAWAHLLYQTKNTRMMLLIDTALAALLALAIILPLMLPEFALMRTIHRELYAGDYGSLSLSTLGAMLFPYPLGQGDNPHGPSGNSWKWREYAGEVFYGNVFFVPLVLLALLARPVMKANTAKLIFQGQKIWLVLALIAFLFAMGDSGLLWNLMVKLPVFDKFSNPFKFMPFVHFFLIICGGVFCQHIIAFMPQKKQHGLANGVLLICALLAFYSAAMAKSAFWHYADRDYPPPPQELAQQLTSTQRSISLAPDRSTGEGFVWTMTLDLPTLYSDYTFGFSGYDQINGETPEVLAFKQKADLKNNSMLEEFGIRDIINVTDAGEFSVAHLKHPKPLVFYKDSDQVVTYHVDWEGITLGDRKNSLPAGTLLLNFLFLPGFHEPSGNAELSTDAYGRMLITLPTPQKKIRVAYVPPYLETGIIAALVLAALFTAVMYANRKTFRLKASG